MDDLLRLRSEFGPLDDAKWRQLQRYFQLLVDWNARINLTAITGEMEVYVKHFYDSLLITKGIHTSQIFSDSARVADVGTGAGFPGLVLAVAAPDKQFVLIDALAKRLKFLDAVCTELGLHNVELVHGRTEDLGRERNFRERFDLVLSRAVARLNVLCELTLPLVLLGGWFISYKGPGAAEEIGEAGSAIQQLGGSLQFNETLPLIKDMGSRILIGVRKDAHTQNQYPRRAGTPQKSPL